MTSKIFRSTVFVAAVVLLCSLGIVMGVLYNHFTGVQVEQLKDELSLAVTGTEQYGNAFLENVEADRFRVTWIDTDGTVLFDTQVDQTTMENHADREEIQEAFSTGSGSAVRTSSTLTEHTYYESRQLKDGTVLRISTSQASAWSLMIGMLWPVIMIVVLAIGLSAFLARRMARKIVEPLNCLDLEHPLKNDVYEEISPLLHRIHRQHNQITMQVEKLRRKTDEFSQVTDNMQEGLILLDSAGIILSINPAAKDLFNTGDDCVGKNFLMIDRSSIMRTAVNNALDKGRGYARANRNGREYQYDLSRIESDGNVVGAVVLAFDITEKYNSEQMRREFSANVSHELKTPLQGIIGSAELLENGLVKPEDNARFVGHIRKEASRLVNLIEDVIRISHLDEGIDIPKEDIDLMAVVKEVTETLQTAAQKRGISIRVSGDHCHIQGVRSMIYEIVQNLCDNAVKYNMDNGTVDVTVKRSGKRMILTVKDTGIGIPPEHQPRIFERFYRVDKSHSKETGGTGLGMAIVKHAAQYHNARIHLQSAPGIGTTVTVTF